MVVRHVDRAGAELDAPGRLDQRADEHHAGGDVLGAVGVVLADIAFGVAELVGENESLAILAQRLPPVLVERMDRHGEEAEVHLILRRSNFVMPGHSPVEDGRERPDGRASTTFFKHTMEDVDGRDKP
jgi:hypothetical protein